MGRASRRPDGCMCALSATSANMHCANHHRTASDPTNLHFTTETIEQSLTDNHSSGQAIVNDSTMGMHA